MCMSAPKIQAPPPPPAPPAMLEQLAPKSQSNDSVKRKSKGLSQYKVPTTPTASTNKLGGIPKKTGNG